MIDGKDAPSTKPGTPAGARPTVEAPANPSPPLTTRHEKFMAVVNEMKLKHDMDESLLFSNMRMGFVVRAKQELAYELRTRYGWGLVIIARLVKAKDHTIVRHRIIQHCLAYKLKLPDGVSQGKVRKKRPLTK